MNIALLYDADGYVELTRRPAVPGGPAGLMGRQVAGKEFLDAYLAHGDWDTLTAVVASRDRAEPLVRTCREHPSSQLKPRQLRVLEEREFFTHPKLPVDLIHHPCPPAARYAWARQALAPGGFALSGVTHTLATPGVAAALCELITAPFEEYDALICTSHAVVEMVRAVTDSYAEYLRDRMGGNPGLRIRLELIPLGVNPDRFRPPTPEERAANRKALAIADDEVMVLCVGRLSHHAKAHPYPVFHAVQEAARRSGRKVHLVFAGWAAHPSVDEAYRAAANFFAPAVRVSFLDGQSAAVRAAVWPAADVFVSLPDNIQETFGLVVIEAMASGLPVLGSNWDGYRDLMVDGETGFMVPVRMVRGATLDATSRLLFTGTNYDHFLAECCQATAVDPAASAEALTRLVSDADLRRRMGEAGRKRVLERFTWERVIRSYESLWAEQQRELARHRMTMKPSLGPVQYPPPERSFAGYPTAWLDDADMLRTAEGALAKLASLLTIPLTNVSAEYRCADAAKLQELLRSAASPRSVADLTGMLEKGGTSRTAARATLAWLLKYGMLLTE